jgi:hypothetical protein
MHTAVLCVCVIPTQIPNTAMGKEVVVCVGNVDAEKPVKAPNSREGGWDATPAAPPSRGGQKEKKSEMSSTVIEAVAAVLGIQVSP